MTFTRPNRWSVRAAALAAVTVAWTVPALAKVRSNTQVRLPDNSYIGDINGDGNQDFVFARGGAVYVTNTDHGNSKILYSILWPGSPIGRIFTGDFQGTDADQICAIHTTGMLTCWGVSTDRTTMWWWFTMGSFIGDDEEVIVGDFNGNGADDILVYKPSTGQLRMFTSQGGLFFQNPSFSLGNLAGTNLANKQLRAGEFGQAVGQTDLLVYDPTNGQVSRFDAVNYGSESPTFWWAFTTGPGFVAPNEKIAVANVEGFDQDNLVLRDTSTGAYRFFRLDWDWSAWNPARIYMDSGQLPIVAGSDVQGFWLRNRGWIDSSSKRDDQMFYYPAYRLWQNTHARMWAGSPYYWWAFSGTALKRVDGDANGDQRSDLSVLGNQTWGTIPLATSKGDGTFAETNTANSDPGMAFTSWAATPGAKLVHGDFDGDGMSDLALVGGKYWGSVPVALSNGDGTYRVKNELLADFPTWASKPNVKVVSGDFDGDGKSDIALVGEIGRHSIAVAYSAGNGGFSVYDIAADSFADLAAFRDFSRNPQVWPKVVAADFNNDGKCDIALVGGTDFYGVPVALSNGRSIPFQASFSFQYQNLAGDGWATNYFHSRAREPGTQAIAGDFDGNGYPDLALVGGSYEETDIFFALNHGNGQFSVSLDTAVQSPVFSQWAQEPGVKVVSGYFNDDAVADIALVGGIGWKSIRLALSNGGLSFRPTNFMNNFGSYAAYPHVWPATNVASNAGRTARSLDQDGDRRGDISLTGGVGWGSMPVGFSRGNGDFKVENKVIDAEWASFAAHTGVSVLSGDFNGDGREDVALCAPGGGPQMVAFANGDGTFRVHKNGTSVSAPTGSRVVAGDFSGDGRTDIITIGGFYNGQPTSGSELSLSNGDGTFLRWGVAAEGTELANLVNSTTAGVQIVAGDFNGDGASDLVAMGGAAGDWVHVYFAVGRSDFFDRVSFQNAAFRTPLINGGKVVAGDFDGDGLDDLYIVRGSGSYLTVGLSLGTGAFVAAPMAAPSFIGWSRSFYSTPVVGDFNGDGASDIALVGGRGWTSVPVAFSTRRTDLLPWTVQNNAVKDFPIFAAATGALAAMSSPTAKVDTVAPPPPIPDPPESIPVHKDLYIPLRLITMPNNPPTPYVNTSWTFEFDICNDNDAEEDLLIQHVLVRGLYIGVGNQWYVNDYWAKGVEVRANGTSADYRYVTHFGGSSPPPNEDTRPRYKLTSVPAHGCHRMYFELPGGHPIGFYQFDVVIDDIEPISDKLPDATISLTCLDTFSGQCSVLRY